MIVGSTEEFGNAIRARRKELGYTQVFVSECTGLSVSFISELENGKSTAELGKALFLANILGIDFSLKPRKKFKIVY